MTEYIHVKIPKILADEIKTKILPKTSYRNVSEFVIDATRRRTEIYGGNLIEV